LDVVSHLDWEVSMTYPRSMNEPNSSASFSRATAMHSALVLWYTMGSCSNTVQGLPSVHIITITFHISHLPRFLLAQQIPDGLLAGVMPKYPRFSQFLVGCTQFLQLAFNYLELGFSKFFAHPILQPVQYRIDVRTRDVRHFGSLLTYLGPISGLGFWSTHNNI